jgi:hypothetical protein
MCRIVLHGVHKIADAIVPDSWLTTSLLWLNSQASSCQRPFTRMLHETARCLFPCLQGKASALPGMAITT